ncbi:DUF922 domain-containing protein [Roseibium sp.]|uniref:DUF922 domain-containing protein n=1 Tax=Roseibium sp. TaxID=1936156 RepID=UPI003BB1CD95
MWTTLLRVQFVWLMVTLTLILVLLPFPALGDVTIRSQTNLYEIGGGTAEELIEEMAQKGPLDVSGSTRHWARTNWRISWQYRYVYRDQTCVMTTVWTELDLEFIYPLWTRKAGASARLKSSWGAMMRELEAHEQGHADMAIDMVEDIDRTLEAMESDISCERLNADARRFGQDKLAELRQQDIDYDRETRHGATTIPPLRD